MGQSAVNATKDLKDLGRPTDPRDFSQALPKLCVIPVYETLKLGLLMAGPTR